MVKIEQDTVDVEAQKEAIAADEAAAAAQAIKDECEGDLAEATPALEAAVTALDRVDEASTAHRQVSDGSCVRHEADQSGQEAGFCRIRKTR